MTRGTILEWPAELVFVNLHLVIQLHLAQLAVFCSEVRVWRTSVDLPLTPESFTDRYLYQEVTAKKFGRARPEGPLNGPNSRA
jgi:hypothetical protein